MARFSPSLAGFQSGEVSPRLDGRTDLQKYFSACSTLENFLVHPTGGATRRPGTRHVAEVKASANTTRLIPFEFGVSDTYILEFGNNYIRFYRNSGQIVSGSPAAAYEIATSYTSAQVNALKFAQSGDVMYITHPSHEISKLARTGHTAWTLTEVTLADGPYISQNATTTTLQSGATTGSGVTLTASAVTGINGGDGFQSTDVGRLVTFLAGYAKITAVASTTSATITILDDFSGTGTSADWSLGAFSDTTGHPSAITFFEERLVFAGTLDQPQTVYFSVAGDFENFKSGTNASDALIFTIGASDVNVTRYLSSGRNLIVGTSGGEFIVSSGSDAAITPTNILIRKQSNYGSADIQPAQIANVTLFVQRAKRKVRELAYEFNTDSYVAPDMTILAEHITEGGIDAMSYQQEPDNVVWCVRGDGQLLSLTYRREEKVVAWSRHKLGGTYTGTHGSLASATYDYGMVESVAVIPLDGSEYQVWLVVKRTIDGATKRYVEYFTPFDFGTDLTDAVFVDSSLSYSGVSATAISGLTHIEGQEVAVIANGAAQANKTVSSGAITSDHAMTKGVIGLPYTSTLRTMRIEGGAQSGTGQGKTKRIHEVTIRMLRTLGAKVGTSSATNDIIPFRSSADEMDQPPDMFDGDKKIEFDGDYDTDGFITVVQDQALPMTILALYPELTVFED
jgi:hypothetical protein